MAAMAPSCSAITAKTNAITGKDLAAWRAPMSAIAAVVRSRAGWMAFVFMALGGLELQCPSPPGRI
ncbi:MAG: hypothetical protein IAG13_00560 [Deltaproteobacteria bacterium]|nr:hypothetical protein [Nannocystaceae bacterium]